MRQPRILVTDRHQEGPSGKQDGIVLALNPPNLDARD